MEKTLLVKNFAAALGMSHKVGMAADLICSSRDLGTAVAVATAVATEASEVALPRTGV